VAVQLASYTPNKFRFVNGITPRQNIRRLISFMNTRRVPDDESIRLELQEALVTFRHWTTQANQAAGVIATGDALLVTYGFSQRLAGILFLASLLPFAVLLLYLIIMNAVAHIINLAMRLEKKLSVHTDSLAITYAKLHMGPVLKKIPNIDSLSEKDLLDLDRELSVKYWLRKRIPLAFCLAAVIQIGLAIVSLTVYQYRFM
jgi:hypothetical protein